MIKYYNFTNKYSLLKFKKAQGHVEMMLSFILFIGAILFIFFFMNPFSKSVDKSNELEQVQRIIMQNISDNSGRLSIVTYDDSRCYNFIDSGYPNRYVEFLDSNPNKTTIYFSDKFPITIAPHKDSIPGCTNYKLGVFSNETIILYDLLKDLAANCNTDTGYKETRKNLGINMDFYLNITNINRETIPDLNFAKKVPTGVEVKSKEFPIRIIKSDGTIIDAIFNIRVW